jgi:hypothetical protein
LSLPKAFEKRELNLLLPVSRKISRVSHTSLLKAAGRSCHLKKGNSALQPKEKKTFKFTEE